MAKGKVLVVGAGIGGLCTAWGLVRRGFAVEVFEQGSIPNPRSSSYDEHRITRHAYGDFAGYARLMPEAFRVYDELFAEIGATHFDPLPLLVIQREEIGWFTKSMGSMDELAVPYRDVPVRELAGRYPMLDPEGVTAAFECEGAGVLFPIRILTDLVVHLAGRGVVFYPNTKVEAIDPERGTVRVGGGRVHAGDAVVVAAGAWADRLVPSLAGLAVPSRQIVLYVAPPPGLHAVWRDAPAIIDLGERSGTYTLPPRPGTRLKVGDHHFTKLGDPDDDRVATEADTARLLAAARLAYRDFDRYAVLERKVCYYTVTEDEGFLVKPIGAVGYLQSACSGHGFKLAALIGDGVARAISGEMRKDDLPGWAAGKAGLAA